MSTTLSYTFSSPLHTPQWVLRGNARERRRIRFVAKWLGIKRARWVKRKLGYQWGIEWFDFRGSLLSIMAGPSPQWQNLFDKRPE